MILGFSAIVDVNPEFVIKSTDSASVRFAQMTDSIQVRVELVGWISSTTEIKVSSTTDK